MTQFTRQNIALILSEGAATIEFTKMDGSERVMRCTMANYLIPQENMPFDAKDYAQGSLRIQKPNMNVLRVFDLDKNDWRSFRVDKVTSVTVLDDRGYVSKPLG